MKKLLLCLFALVAVCGVAVWAQDGARDISGTWQGTLPAGKGLRTVLKISKADAGGWKTVLYSIDQGGQPLNASSTTVQGSTVKFAVTMIGGTFEGKLSADGTSIAGTWTQGDQPLQITYVKTTPETAWSIPEPPAAIPAMATDAKPNIDVATIKPSNPEQQGKGFTVRGRQFITINTTLIDILQFAYNVQAKQIVGAPGWAETEKYDLAMTPDLPGRPNDKQWKTMIQKLIAERFKLTFHEEKRDMAVYALTVAKSGPKMTKSESDGGLPGLMFRGLGSLPARNATMADFANVMQSAVLDKPVVDQTGIAGRWDFTLNWTPDDSQFLQLRGGKPLPVNEKPDAPPGLFSAIQEQVGLKLESTKAPVAVMAVDHVEKPSDN